MNANAGKAGVYMIRSRLSGSFYVGVSEAMDDRLYQHLLGVRNGRHQQLAVRRAFAGHRPEDIEMRVLEFVQRPPKTSHYQFRLMLRVQERHWILQLKPDLNGERSKRSPLRPDIASLPVGVPADLAAEAELSTVESAA